MLLAHPLNGIERPGMTTSSVPQRRRGRQRSSLLAAAAALALTSGLVVATQTTNAVPPAPGTVFDDFEDGDASDWIFFGGNAAGGGGGALADRPAEGGFYLSTGWGGDGTASGFYGGTFRNLDDSAQVALPPDPWFNMWVLNQSDASVDRYTLELTLREDTNGDGWTNGSEDSIGLDTTFTSAQFDDQWTMLSAPLSSWFDRGTGGNAVFDGAVDEMVIVLGGVQGAPGSVIELDIDTITFTSGAPAGFDEVVFDDMEHGDPFGNGWFSFNGSVGGGGIGPNGGDLPPALGGGFSLETGWGSGGTPGFYGGFGRTSPSDLSGTEYFNFWINPDAGQDYTLELNLQEDDDGNGAGDPATDDEFQFNCVVGPAGPCATAGGGWQLVSIPLDDFVDDNSFFTGGNGVLDPTPAARGGNGELISVVVAVIGSGTDVNFRTDYWAFSARPLEPDVSTIVDDFESGLPFGSAVPNGEPLGFYTFRGDGNVAISSASTPPAPVLPAVGTPNNVMQMDVDVASFAGYIHAFENAAVDSWVTQDWSTSEGISFWMYGSGSGTQMFIDILDNRNPGSTTDDAERWTVPFVDDVAGWRLIELPFSSFVRKEIGNGAPNDGLGLFQMHGYALGTLGTGGPRTFYFDEVRVYGIAEPPELAVNLSRQNTFIEEGTTGNVGVKLNRPMGPDDPAQVSINFATERSNAIPGEDFTPTSGTLTFVNGGPTELFFPVETFDDTKFTGDLQIVVRLTDPVDVQRGTLFQGSVLIDDDDPFDPDLLDDFEQGAFLWDRDGMIAIDAERVALGDADERPGQDPAEHVAKVSTPHAGAAPAERLEAVIDHLGSLLPATDRPTTRRIERAIDRLTDSLDQTLWDNGFFLDEDAGDRVFVRHRQAVRDLTRINEPDGGPVHAAIDEIAAIDAEIATLVLDVSIANSGDAKDIATARADLDDAASALADGLPDQALQHFRKAWRAAVRSLAGLDDIRLGSVERDFPIGQDWTGTESIDFWFQGTGSGEEITIELQDNRAPDPGPSGWTLAWADEFDEPAGTPPNPANWAYELGDTTPDGKNGWGNEELQYYTDDPDNAATDGNGNLVITLEEADGSQECYYGPCEFESARLITQNKAEFAYGRIESRLRVPTGGDGLWPAFWSLGTDITYNPWPGAGEIDVMEYVSRIPNEIFGTIHGPGYSGGASFNGIYDFGERVDQEFHTFAVEWEPDVIRWYVDGILYHEAEPSDVPGPWVFDKPFFLLLNFAIGGNFGGAVDPANAYPQEYLVDYVRVYQGPDTAERFETTFTDTVAGWQQVSIPVADFARSADQPAGAPDDGLTLTDVWGYALHVPYPAAGTYRLDLVQRTPFPPPSELVVTTAADDGPGSLREALALIADDGTITFDPSLAGATMTLTSGQLTIPRSVTIDASAAAPFTISGGGSSRVIEVAPGVVARINDLEIRDGAAGPQGGGVLNSGTLTLLRVVVADNVENSAGPANFQFGGGGIYNADGAVLDLIDSTVRDNRSLNQPGGGVYSFFNTTTNIVNGTVSGNVSGDVAGGLRSLGNVTITDSTITGNVSTAWHGGGIFATDGTVTISGSTISANSGPAGTAGGLMVATFGAPVMVTMQDSVVTDNVSYGCQVEGDSAVAVLTSLGGNTFTDASCNPTPDDVILP